MFELHQKILDSPLSVGSTPYGESVVVVSLSGEMDRSNVASSAMPIDYCPAE